MTEANKTNLAIWNAVEATDPKHTKAFNRGGGFKGTATNVTYLVKKASNMFGPVGIGWGWKVLDESVMDGAGTDKIHRVKLQLWYKWNGERGEIEHFGQTTFVGKNKNGLFTDEEAPKKSLTDALSKCLSMLGFAADVHLGLYDDNKYVNDLKYDFQDNPEFNNDNGGDNVDRGDNVVDMNKGGGAKADGKSLLQALLDEVSECKEIKDVTGMMNHKDVKADLRKLTKAEEDQVRAAATQKLKDLGWCPPKKEGTTDA